MINTTMLSFDLSPVRLNYVAALRGVSTKALRYAQIGQIDPHALICLAASNPQGEFYGVLESADAAEASTREAQVNKVGNISFFSSSEALPQPLDLLCCLAGDTLQTASDRAALFSLAQSHLAPGGLLTLRYRAYNNPDEILSFLIREYAPEMTPAQALEFLGEIEALGTLYFKNRPAARDLLAKAIKDKTPDSFFEACGAKGDAPSGTLAVMEGLLPAGFSFVGDADIGANYLELAAPPESHATLNKCKDHLLYEPIKDFALERTIRNDVWVKRPAVQTFDPALLFGNFTFGITTPKDRVPQTVSTQGGAISLQTPLFTRLIELLCILPTSIGDFLGHPAGFGMDADEVIAALQVLVATGIARPMRAHYEGKGAHLGESRPSWATPYNEYIFHTTLSEPTVRLASAIIGDVLTLPVRDALVLQAIHRVGLPNSASAFRSELKQMMKHNPSVAALVTESAEPSDEVVNNIITDVVTRGLVRWYAYGLLAA